MLLLKACQISQHDQSWTAAVFGVKSYQMASQTGTTATRAEEMPKIAGACPVPQWHVHSHAYVCVHAGITL